MEIYRSELKTEKLPNFYKNEYISTIINEVYFLKFILYF